MNKQRTTFITLIYHAISSFTSCFQILAIMEETGISSSTAWGSKSLGTDHSLSSVNLTLYLVIDLTINPLNRPGKRAKPRVMKKMASWMLACLVPLGNTLGSVGSCPYKSSLWTEIAAQIMEVIPPIIPEIPCTHCALRVSSRNLLRCKYNICCIQYLL